MLEQALYQAQDEARLRDAAIKEVAYAIERAKRCASSSYGEEAGERVEFQIKFLLGIN